MYQSLIMINSDFTLDKNCYPETFLENYKFEIKKKKLKLLITDNLESSDDDDSEEEETSE